MVKTIKPCKTKLVNFRVDEKHFDMLKALADEHEEGNMSVYLRKMIAKRYQAYEELKCKPSDVSSFVPDIA